MGRFKSENMPIIGALNLMLFTWPLLDFVSLKIFVYAISDCQQSCPLLAVSCYNMEQ
jgi:hypothetical protein